MHITQEASLEDLRDIAPDFISERRAYIEQRIRENAVFVAQEDDINLGFLIYSVWWGSTPFVEIIKVKEKHRRKGVGTRLLDAVIEEMKSRNFKLLLSSTETDNDYGLAFHDKHGFEELSVFHLPDFKEKFYKKEL